MDEVSVPAPPGWYMDGAGVLRWWDGAAWGPPAAVESVLSPRDARTWGMLSHLGLLMFVVVVPLVIRQTLGTRNDSVRKHATSALNAQITFGILWNLFPLSALILAVSTGSGAWWALVAGNGVAFVWILVGSIVGAHRAWHGRPSRYPGAIPFVRGGWRRGEDELGSQ